MSETIYQNKPYTYLIKFIPTGQVYYGVRWGNKVSPEDDLWKKYFTSSKYVKELIDEYGPEWFEYEVRKTFDNEKDAQNWEERVLKRMHVVESEQWINRTDNHSIAINEKTKEKTRQTNLERYGIDNVSKSDVIKKKIRDKHLEKYGVETSLLNTDVKIKIKDTLLKRYGVDNPMQSDIIRNKAKQTNLERYGFESPAENKNIKEKTKQTNLQKYGTECTLLNPNIKEKTKKTMIEKYGVDHPSKRNLKINFKGKYKCAMCDFVNNSGNIGKHHKETGHIGRIILEQENDNV